MFKFDTMHWCIIQLNFLKQAIRENVGRNDEYLQNLLDLCKFIANPTRVEPFEDVYEDLMAFSAEQIEAYRQEMEERRRLDSISTRKYTEELIAEQEKEIAANRQAIEASRQELAANKQEIAANKQELAAIKQEQEAEKARADKYAAILRQHGLL